VSCRGALFSGELRVLLSCGIVPLVLAIASSLAEEGNLADDTQNGVASADKFLIACKTQLLPRVKIVSSNRILCESLTAALSQRGFLDTKSCSSDSVQGEANPDVLLVDAGTCGVEAISELNDRHKAAKIVVFGFDEREASVVEYVMAGVSGFAHVNASLPELSSAIDAVIRGELKCSSKVAGLLLNQIHLLAARERNTAWNDILTMREREIASLMGRGLSNKQIASTLNVQGNTVKNHVHSILSKLGMHRRGEVIARLHRSGISERENELVPYELHD
jgi:two-component system, NarL family, nitrate/nitrite response regulator NarL